MSKAKADAAETAAATGIRGAKAWLILAALVAGLAAGAGATALGDGLREPALRAASMIGGLWLNALQMTVIPLIVALLVTGISLIAANWFLLLTGIAVFGLLVIRTATEEANLLARFGEGYRTYMNRTGRFLPNI